MTNLHWFMIAWIIIGSGLFLHIVVDIALSIKRGEIEL